MFRYLVLIVLIVSAVHPTMAGDRFFPKGSLSDNADASEFMELWYGKHLRAMNEGLLTDADAGQHVYRLTWLRTFHHPMVFRLAIAQDGTVELHVKVTSGAGGYDPGVLTVNKTIHLTKVQADIMLAGLEQIEFWTMTSYLERTGVDGAEWIVEGVKNARYHVVDRWSPEGSAFQFWALSLMWLSGMDLEPIY